MKTQFYGSFGEAFSEFRKAQQIPALLWEGPGLPFLLSLAKETSVVPSEGT